jgi:hypothetical protein
VRLHIPFPVNGEYSSLSPPLCSRHTKIKHGRPEVFGVLMLTVDVIQINIVVTLNISRYSTVTGLGQCNTSHESKLLAVI